MKSPRVLWLAASGLAAIVVGANFMSGPLNQLFLALPGIDKVSHIVFHGALFVCVRALAANRGAGPRRQTEIALAVGLAVAVGDESLQGLTTARSVELADVVADCVGLTLGWVFAARPKWAVALPATVVALAIGANVIHSTYARLHDFNLAVRYEGQHDFVRARDHYLKALSAGLVTPAVYNGLGWVEIESGQGDAHKAVEWARTAFEMQPGNPDVLDTYGWALHHAGRSREALPLLLEAFDKKPRMYCIHYHLGEVYLALGRAGEAAVHFRRQLGRTDTREAQFARQALDRMAVRQ